MARLIVDVATPRALAIAAMVSSNPSKEVPLEGPGISHQKDIAFPKGFG